MLPYEVAVEYFIRPLRGILVHKLSDEGYSQTAIARALGLSQPMVHKILRDDVAKYYEELSEAGFNSSEVDVYVNTLLNFLLSREIEKYNALFTTLVNKVLSSARLCGVHLRKDSGLPPSCSVCVSVFTPAMHPLVAEYENYLKILLKDPRTVELVPEVGMNIAYSTPAPASISDVVGLPGRIVKLNDRAEAVGTPCFGGSRHTATILIKASKYNKSLRACASIRHMDKYVEKLRALGFTVAESGPHKSLSEVIEAVEAIFMENPDVTAIADRGGLGIEPIIYVFAKDLAELIDILQLLP